MEQLITAKYTFPKERNQLLRMAKKDQYIRVHGDFSKPETSLEMSRLDLRNQKRLIGILKVIKLPSVKNIGSDGAEAVWLIAQHAGYDLSLKREVLKLMLLTTKDDPTAGCYYGIPYLTDSVNIMEGEPQIYGTQFWASPSGVPEAYPIEDLKNIDARRDKFGLKPFSEYKSDIVEMTELTKRSVYQLLY